MQADVNLLFDDKVAVTATRNSTTTLKVGTNRARGNRVNIEVQVTEVFNNLTSLQVDIFDSADDSTYATVPLVSSGAILLASLTAGAKIAQFTLPPTHKAYIRPKYTVVGTAPTTGKVYAGIVVGPDMVN